MPKVKSYAFRIGDALIFHGRAPTSPWRKRGPYPKITSERLRQDAAVQELFEGPGAMAHGVFHTRIDLAKGLVEAVGNEDGIIAEAQSAARRKCQRAMNFALEGAAFALRHGQRQ